MPLGSPRSGHVAYVRDGRLESGLLAVEARMRDAGTDGEVLDGDLVPGAAEAARAGEMVWRVEQDGPSPRIVVPEHRAPQAPPVWFVHVDEPRASPASTNLVAFLADPSTGTTDAGTVLSRFRFGSLGVRNDLQLGAIRWHRAGPRPGLVHQIFVAEDWRRRNVGTVLLHAADAWHQANAWPGHLHGDGRRTTLGERFLATLQHPARFTRLEKTMPPMDPAARAAWDRGQLRREPRS